MQQSNHRNFSLVLISVTYAMNDSLHSFAFLGLNRKVKRGSCGGL